MGPGSRESGGPGPALDRPRPPPRPPPCGRLASELAWERRLGRQVSQLL